MPEFRCRTDAVDLRVKMLMPDNFLFWGITVLHTIILTSYSTLYQSSQSLLAHIHAATSELLTTSPLPFSALSWPFFTFSSDSLRCRCPAMLPRQADMYHTKVLWLVNWDWGKPIRNPFFRQLRQFSEWFIESTANHIEQRTRFFKDSSPEYGNLSIAKKSI
jgi:hypothetical protein